MSMYQAFCYYGENLLALERCGEAIRSLQEAEKLVNLTLLNCKEYNKLKGIGLAARPETHPALKQMQAMVKRVKDKCERENGLM
jgi:5,10-methylenetetrahydrofolate reductase